MLRRVTLALSIAASARAQTATVVGNVVDSADVPIVQANVELVGLARAGTDSGGIYRFRNVPPGTFILRTAKLGYAPRVQVITVKPTDTLVITVVLSPSSATLQPIVVKAESTITVRSDPTGFLWRKKTGMGYYLDAMDIEKAHAPDLERLVKNIPGLRVINGGIEIHRQSQSFRNPCYGAQILLDGVPLAFDFDLNTLPVDVLRGIEVYKGVADIPSELRTFKNTCGVVAIWTRAR